MQNIPFVRTIVSAMVSHTPFAPSPSFTARNHERGIRAKIIGMATKNEGFVPEIEAVGRVHGFITRGERGENGFGYDSLFFYEPMGKTFAQMGPDEKNSVSHRKNALALVLAALD